MNDYVRISICVLIRDKYFYRVKHYSLYKHIYPVGLKIPSHRFEYKILKIKYLSVKENYGNLY